MYAKLWGCSFEVRTWQCRHLKIFSTTKEPRIPSIMYNETWKPNPLALVASGMRWKKAPPNRPPTEKLTR